LKITELLTQSKLKVACLQEVKKPFSFKMRESSNVRDAPLVADYEFPAKDKLHYDNYITGFEHAGGHDGFNVIMSNDLRSTLPKNRGKDYKDVRINPP
jgi:hypothetical protein